MVNEKAVIWHKHLTKLLIAYLVLFSFPATASDALTFAEAKAYYTFEVINNINWPQERQMNEFHVGVIGVDDEGRAAFESGNPKILQGKAVHVNFVTDNSADLNRYSVIYIAEKKLVSAGLIFAENPEALIITDGKTHGSAKLINLISTRNKVSISIHRNNLLARGFKVSIGLLSLAGSREDLQQGLRDLVKNLQELSLNVEIEQQALQVLGEELGEKSKRLDEANQELSDNQVVLNRNGVQLNRMLTEIETSRNEIASNQSEIDRQRFAMEEAISALLLKEQEAEKFQELIERSQEVLTEHLSKINQQGNALKQKDETIDVQRMLMILVMLASLVLFFAIYFLLKLNRLKNQANEKLETVNSKLYELATTDDMTQVFNRRHFLEMAEREFVRQKRRASKSTLLMVDIDHFKKVNDRYGHAMGDETIRAVAGELGANLREYDLLGRLGGEEFALMLADCNLELAQEVAQRLCIDVAALELKYKDFSTRVTVSIGLSEMRSEDSNLEIALHRADKALYQAKEGGRNSVVVYEEASSQ